MPWLELCSMDQKVLFMADYLRGGVTMTALCARYGISRKTGYKWVSRYREHGLSGLNDQSRAPVRVNGKNTLYHPQGDHQSAPDVPRMTRAQEAPEATGRAVPATGVTVTNHLLQYFA